MLSTRMNVKLAEVLCSMEIQHKYKIETNVQCQAFPTVLHTPNGTLRRLIIEARHSIPDVPVNSPLKYQVVSNGKWAAERLTCMTHL